MYPFPPGMEVCGSPDTQGWQVNPISINGGVWATYALGFVFTEPMEPPPTVILWYSFVVQSPPPQDAPGQRHGQQDVNSAFLGFSGLFGWVHLGSRSVCRPLGLF